MEETILVVDNEADIVRFVEVNLRLEGFEVISAADGEQALQRARRERPALILLDVMMPKLDGFEVCRRLRGDPLTSHIPIIMLTARALTIDKVVGLTAGADDYVLKPFDPVELVARVKTTLRRAGELQESSPLTGLPGNHRSTFELAKRLAENRSVALVHADLNDFKPFNDRYGFVRGDDVIMFTARVLVEALEAVGDPDGFVGHIGGDDFIVLCDAEHVRDFCSRVIADFDGQIGRFYNHEDAQRRYLEVEDRRGEWQRFSLLSIALGVATNEHRTLRDHREMVEVATEMKSYVKRKRDGSAYAIDTRGAPAQADTDRPA